VYAHGLRPPSRASGQALRRLTVEAGKPRLRGGYGWKASATWWVDCRAFRRPGSGLGERQRGAFGILTWPLHPGQGS